MCELATIVKDHMKTLMRVFKDDLAEYNMQDGLTSKCLNTSVMILFMFLGSKALDHTRYCDVESVVSRAAQYKSQNKVQEFWDDMHTSIDAMSKHMLSMSSPKRRSGNVKAANSHKKDSADVRTLYYIMLTHADTDKGMFPGHVFIIDKSFDSKGSALYDLYQSYIQEYDLAKFIDLNSGTTRKSATFIRSFLTGLKEFFKKKTWDAKCSHWWKMLSEVDGKNFEGYPIEHTIFFCQQTIPIYTCIDTLRQILKKRLPMILKKHPEMHAEVVTIIQKLGGSSK